VWNNNDETWKRLHKIYGTWGTNRLEPETLSDCSKAQIMTLTSKEMPVVAPGADE